MAEPEQSSAPPYRSGEPHLAHQRATRERARQAIVQGDPATARAVLHQLLEDESAGELTELMADALVATATPGDDLEARGRYRRTQQDLEAFLSWLDAADLDADDLGRIQRHIRQKLDLLERQATERRAEELAQAGTARLRRVGAGWLEAKLIPKPNGRRNGPYLSFRARVAGRRRSLYIGKLPGAREQ